MFAVLIAMPLVAAAVVLLPLGSWTRRYFEATLWPTRMDEGR